MLKADQNLLFGFLALQNDFISREQLIAAVSVWLQDKSERLDEILLRQDFMRDSQHDVLKTLVEVHLEGHENDARKSLAALSDIGPVRDELSQLNDTDVQETLTLVRKVDSAFDTEQTLDIGSCNAGDKRFRILRRHAKGGLGEVFVARDEELKRKVALKEIQTKHADDPEARARFVLEGEVTGGLEHPGIVPIYSLGQYDNGRPYYAMRFIRGEDLRASIQRYHSAPANGSAGEGMLQLRKLLTRFVEVCNAVHYAHSRGVIHRDLKPSNIMLGKYGETLVVDWGLAKLQGRSDKATSDGETTLLPPSASGSAPTQFGSAIGTPAYMPPEQAAGDLDSLGPASDVFSLGATLYHLLTGQPPQTDKDLGVVLEKVKRGEFPAPREIKPNIPSALESVCLKALATQPEARYSSPQELGDDIDRFLADEQVLAHAETAVDRSRRWLRNHPKSVAALAATALVGLTSSLVVAAVVSGKNQELSDANSGLLTANEQERAAKEEAEKKRKEADEAKDQVARARNNLLFERGHAELVAGNRSFGFLLLAQCLHRANESGMKDLERAIRQQLAVWGRGYGWEAEYFSAPARPSGARLEPDGTFSVFTAASDELCAYAFEDREIRTDTLLQGKSIRNLVVRSDRQRVAVVDASGKVTVFDKAGNKFGRSLGPHERISCLAFEADGEGVLIGRENGSVESWNPMVPDSRKLLVDHPHELRAIDGKARSALAITAIAQSPDGKALATGQAGGLVRITDTETGEIESWFRFGSAIDLAVFNGEGSLLFVTSRVGDGRIWDRSTNKVLGPPLRHADKEAFARALTASFADDGRAITVLSLHKGPDPTGGYPIERRVWEVPFPVQGSAQEVRMYVEMETGWKVNESGGFEKVTGAKLDEYAAHLSKLEPQIDFVTVTPTAVPLQLEFSPGQPLELPIPREMAPIRQAVPNMLGD